MIPLFFGRVLSQLSRSDSESQLCYLLVWVLGQHHHFVGSLALYLTEPTSWSGCVQNDLSRGFRKPSTHIPPHAGMRS